MTAARPSRDVADDARQDPSGRPARHAVEERPIDRDPMHPSGVARGGSWEQSPPRALRPRPAATPAPAFVAILAEDPDLGDGLSAADFEAARRLFVAPLIHVMAPRWHPPAFDAASTYGLLVLDGLLGRRVRVGGAVATELLGGGDILRPWDMPTWANFVAAQSDWRIFRPARIAVLDERITRLIGSRPQLTITFASRLFRRARNSTYLLAVSHLARVDQRLLAALWHLASNWGRVTPDGVRIPFRLTHELLAEIVGARRPSVTIALSTLQQQGLVIRTSDGCYVLVGEPTTQARRGDFDG
jgi:CRP/FNR family transcriptional regulator, cyclic AMP receptor protein